MKTLITTINFCLGFWALSQSAMAATWYVDTVGGGTGTSSDPMLPQVAIDASVSGDKIILARGTYNLESGSDLDLDLGGKNLILVGDGPGSTRVDCSESCLDVYDGSEVSVSDMTFENGNNSSYVLIDESSTGRFSNVEVSGSSYAGIRSEHNSKLEIRDSIFDQNYYAVYSDMYYSDDSELNVVDTQFSNNTYGVLFGNGNVSILGSHFEYNDTAICIQSPNGPTNVEARENTFEGNEGSISLNASSYIFKMTGSIANNQISNDTGSAISSNGPFDFIIIEGNHIEGGSAFGISLNNSISKVYNNLLTENKVGIYSDSSKAVIAYNTVSGSYGCTGAFHFYDGDTSLVFNNISWNGSYDGFWINNSPGLRMGYNDSYANGTNYNGVYVDLGGNRQVSPGFVAPGFDFHLSATSLLIDKARSVYIPFDIEGTTRRGISTQQYPDIGAYEYK